MAPTAKVMAGRRRRTGWAAAGPQRVRAAATGVQRAGHIVSPHAQLVIDGQVAAVFAQKQVFGPRTVKSQPIWIKLCTHLLLYGIHLWADDLGLDRDQRVGGCTL